MGSKNAPTKGTVPLPAAVERLKDRIKSLPRISKSAQQELKGLIAELESEILKILWEAAETARIRQDKSSEEIKRLWKMVQRVRDVLRRHRLQTLQSQLAEFKELAIRDPKTRLLNHSEFMDRVGKNLVCSQPGLYIALGLLDLTDFKKVNEELGHDVGDLVIKQVAQLLVDLVRSEDRSADLVAQTEHGRFGGDEFCFFIPDLPNPGVAYQIAERFRQAVENFEWRELDSSITWSVTVDIGVVCLSVREGKAVNLSQLLKRADQLMYQAKREREPGILERLLVWRSSPNVQMQSVYLKDGELVPAVEDDESKAEP